MGRNARSLSARRPDHTRGPHGAFVNGVPVAPARPSAHDRRGLVVLVTAALGAAVALGAVASMGWYAISRGAGLPGPDPAPDPSLVSTHVTLQEAQAIAIPHEWDLAKVRLMSVADAKHAAKHADYDIIATVDPDPAKDPLHRRIEPRSVRSDGAYAVESRPWTPAEHPSRGQTATGQPAAPATPGTTPGGSETPARRYDIVRPGGATTPLDTDGLPGAADGTGSLTVTDTGEEAVLGLWQNDATASDTGLYRWDPDGGGRHLVAPDAELGIQVTGGAGACTASTTHWGEARLGRSVAVWAGRTAHGKKTASRTPTLWAKALDAGTPRRAIAEHAAVFAVDQANDDVYYVEDRASHGGDPAYPERQWTIWRVIGAATRTATAVAEGRYASSGDRIQAMAVDGQSLAWTIGNAETGCGGERADARVYVQAATGQNTVIQLASAHAQDLTLSGARVAWSSSANSATGELLDGDWPARATAPLAAGTAGPTDRPVPSPSRAPGPSAGVAGAAVATAPHCGPIPRPDPSAATRAPGCSADLVPGPAGIEPTSATVQYVADWTGGTLLKLPDAPGPAAIVGRTPADGTLALAGATVLWSERASSGAAQGGRQVVARLLD
ncbi:MAG: hypothetical protein LBM66_04770 [Bifidobacteriaceae bacterium]|jgi:hypothetical protein|nr:hypothetical protein [Bifidobacteriaceae bacterium]